MKFSLRPGIGRVFSTVALGLIVANVHAGDYVQGKVSSAGEQHDPETYRLSGVYGIPFSDSAGTSLELDFSFTTNDIKFQDDLSIRNGESLDLRPESAGLFVSQQIPLSRGTFCSDLYVRSGMVYTEDSDSNVYRDTLGMGNWSPGLSFGLSHRSSTRTSYLVDLTHAGGDNRFTVGVSYQLGMTYGL